MTDKQIANFILYRAQQAGRPLKLTSPRLVLHKEMSPLLYLGIVFNTSSGNNTALFLVRFTNRFNRGMFKINLDTKDFKEWFSEQMAQRGKFYPLNIDYDLNALPQSLKHFVSYAIIEALKTNGMGFDAFSLSYNDDLELIRQNETYEEVAIESDLMCFELNDLS